tara:strand:- start:1787 stop:2344 length:558 start_codon:yes stop_codon:yes gene_type:complete
MNDKLYFEYLKNISWKGKAYRDLVVYPLIEKWAKGSVLDVGCGIGSFVKRNENYKGVDINKECVMFCKNAGLDVKEMELDVLPFKNYMFDTIILDNVLEHIEDPDSIVREISRVLRPNGRIIVLVPGHKGYKADDDHKNFYDFKALDDLGKKYSLAIEKKISLPLPFLSKYLSFFCYFAVFRQQN